MLFTHVIKKGLNSARVKVAAFRDCRRGVAALEFVLIFPIFIIVFFSIVELAYYMMVDRRAQFAVDFAAEFMSRDGDSSTSWEEIWVMEDLWQIVNVTSFYNTGGDAYTNSRGKYTRSFASIEFDAVPAGCSGAACDYEPKVNWSFRASQGISNPRRRSCTQVLVPNADGLDETKLPEGVKGRSALAVADFTYKYRPILNSGLISEQEKHIFAIRKTRGGASLGRSAFSGHFVEC